MAPMIFPSNSSSSELFPSDLASSFSLWSLLSPTPLTLGFKVWLRALSGIGWKSSSCSSLMTYAGEFIGLKAKANEFWSNRWELYDSTSSLECEPIIKLADD